MNFIKRYWAAGLILAVVVAHATIIGYVRTRVARLTNAKSTAIEVGTFRFQNIKDYESVYQFRLYAVADQGHRNQAEETIKKLKIEILESAEQLLRQVDPEWLADPAQTMIRERLMDLVGKQISKPLVQRVIITEWLKVPSTALSTTVTSMPVTSTLSPDDQESI